jgi:CHAD domain-containing protein
MLRRDVRRLIGLDLAVRRGVEDAVHQMRVTARRIRSSLKTFRPLLDPEWTGSLRDELSWLADELGGARDSEVLLDRLLGHLDDLPPDLVVGPVRARLTQVLGANLESGRESAIAMLDSERYVVLLERLVDAGWEPMTAPEAEEPTGDAIPALIKSAWKKLAADVEALDPSGVDTAQWHKVRIESKRLRYSCEATVPIFGKPAKELAKQAESLQTSLGENQDAIIAADQLRALATGRSGGAVAFTLGLLYARQTQAAAAARARFRRDWSEASRSRYRRWLSK